MKCSACGGNTYKNTCLGLGSLGENCPKYLVKQEKTNLKESNWTDVLSKEGGE